MAESVKGNGDVKREYQEAKNRKIFQENNEWTKLKRSNCVMTSTVKNRNRRR